MRLSRTARVTSATLASLATVVAATACSAPPETTGTEGAAVLGGGEIRFCLAPNDPISTETQPPLSTGQWTCGCYTAPVPKSLAGMDCTQGVEIHGYECDGTPYTAWAWACPTYAVRYALAAQSNGDFGGELPASEDVIESPLVETGPVYNDCYGPPDPGYAVITESNATYRGCSPIGCQAPVCGGPKM